jgi:methylisocitrate lyase
MQTRAELYETIGYFDYEALDSQIARSTLPQWPPADVGHGGQQG